MKKIKLAGKLILILFSHLSLLWFKIKLSMQGKQLIFEDKANNLKWIAKKNISTDEKIQIINNALLYPQIMSSSKQNVAFDLNKSRNIINSHWEKHK